MTKLFVTILVSLTIVIMLQLNHTATNDEAAAQKLPPPGHSRENHASILTCLQQEPCTEPVATSVSTTMQLDLNDCNPDGGKCVDCIKEITEAHSRLVDNPTGFYVNVHSDPSSDAVVISYTMTHIQDLISPEVDPPGQ